MFMLDYSGWEPVTATLNRKYQSKTNAVSPTHTTRLSLSEYDYAIIKHSSTVIMTANTF